MTTVYVKEQHASGSLSSSSPNLQTLERTFTRTFHVKMSTWEDGQKVVERAVDPRTGLAIPQMHQSYRRIIGGGGGEAEATSYASNINIVRQSEKERIWTVTVTYDRRDSDPNDPLQKPFDVRIGFENFQEPVENDIFGNPIWNRAFEKFNPVPTRDASRMVLTITRNEKVFDIIQARKFQDAINVKPALGFLEPRQGKMTIGAVLHRYPAPQGGTFHYWTVTYTIKVKEDNWLKKILNQGLVVRADGVGGEPGQGTPRIPLSQVQKRITDKNGIPVRVPRLLDEHGGELGAGLKPVILEFKVLRELDFNDIKPKLPEYKKGW